MKKCRIRNLMRKRDYLIKWGDFIYRVRVTSEDTTHWCGKFKSFYNSDNTWSEWMCRGAFPKNKAVILARI